MLTYTWRWFGPGDPVSLAKIKQTGVTGIVTALHQVPTGKGWELDDILQRKTMIETYGLRWMVVESVPVHEDIKLQRGQYKHFIENYKKTITNLAQCGIKYVCYNFMPVLDWNRTNLKYDLNGRGYSIQYLHKAFMAFELFVLKRKKAFDELTTEQVRDAEKYYQDLSGQQKDELIKSIMLGFPGSGEELSIDELQQALSSYNDVTNEEYREHLISFLREIIPVAEEAGVRMLIHPDDPPWSVLGLPRIVSNKDDMNTIIRAVDLPANGFLFCTGSLGAGGFNDLQEIIETFASRIHFLHLRNITRTGQYDFHETFFPEGDIDMKKIIKKFIDEQNRRLENGENDTIIIRPDHGVLMPGDTDHDYYPGYSFMGRMNTVSEIKTIESALEKK